jgi:hypothetical protein
MTTTHFALSLLFPLLVATGSLHVSVETWRWLPHSYAIVGQEIALQLAQDRGGWRELLAARQIRPSSRHLQVNVTIFEAPVYLSSWRNRSGLRSQDAERELRAIPPTPVGVCPDVVFRAYFPLNFHPWPLNIEGNSGLMASCRPLVLTFGTTEYVLAIPEMKADPSFDWPDLGKLEYSSVFLLPPSEWAAHGFVFSGVPRHKLWLLPHGANVDVFRFVLESVLFCL